MSGVEIIILIFGIIGTVAFSISGALCAIENKLDLFGVCILGVVTACGGGVIRDIMLQRDIAMFTEWHFPLISFVTSLLVFIIMYKLKNLEWENSNIYKITYNLIDSIGLGAFVVVGANAAISTTSSIFPIVFHAVLTACGGGLLRDMMVAKIPDIFRKHIYAIAAIVTALFHYLLNYVGCNYLLNVILTVILIVVIRMLASYFKLSLPKVKLKEDEEELN